MPISFKRYWVSLLIWGVFIFPDVSFGQADTTFIQFCPKAQSTYSFFDIDHGKYAEDLTYRKYKGNDDEILFWVKKLMFVHRTRTMRKTVVQRKNVEFSSDPLTVSEIENYIENLQKTYPLGGLPSQPGVKKLFIVEDEGGDFLTLYEVRWQLFIE